MSRAFIDRASRLVFAFTLVLGAAVDASRAQNELKLVPNDADAGDRFGSGVGINSAGYVLVGAYTADNGGSAYVFKPSISGLVQDAKLTPADATLFFGQAVALGGTYAVVGAPGDSGQGSQAGAVYIFKKTASGWVQDAKLYASDAAGGDGLGVSVGISEPYVIAGASGKALHGLNSGAAYVFEHTASGWVQRAELAPSDAAENDSFGFSASIGDPVAIVGAYGKAATGAAYIFKRNGTAWTQDTKLLPSVPENGERYGFAVSAKALRVAVGSQDGNGATGDAYVYRSTQFGWVEEARFIPPDTNFDQFGTAISIDSPQLVIGATSDSEAGFRFGAVYVFKLINGTWSQTAKLTASDGASFDGYGFHVSVSGRKLVTGAQYHHGAGSQSGQAYWYAPLPCPDCHPCEGCGE